MGNSLKGGIFMKKLICVLLSFVMVISLFAGSFTALAAESQESSNIGSFIDGITKLVQEYDVGKEFTTPENDEPMQIQSFLPKIRQMKPVITLSKNISYRISRPQD